MMNVRTTQSKQAQAGFTLVELSIVLGVMTVLAVNFTPGFISAQREGLAEQTVETYYRLADAAVAYYHNEGEVWPGMESAEMCTISAQAGIQALSSANYLPQGDVTNPWGGEFSLAGHCNTTDGVDCTSCALQIKSVGIPDAVNNMLTNLLPLAESEGDGGVSMLVQSDALGSSGGGGDMPSGGIMMSDQDCPDGWSHYDMAGRMPVGAGSSSSLPPRTFTLGEYGADSVVLLGKSQFHMSDKFQGVGTDTDPSYWSQHNGSAGYVDGGLFDSFKLEINGSESANLITGEGAESDVNTWQRTDMDGLEQVPSYVYSPHKVLNFCQKD